MLFKDFFFSFKNIHISFLEKKNVVKLLKVGISTLYKFFILELIIYQFFYKKDLDKIARENFFFFNMDLFFLFKYFGSLRQEHSYEDFFHENLKEFKEKNVNLLEIGVAKGSGLASLYFYLLLASLIGIDNNPFRNIYKSKRIRTIYGDISSKKVLRNLSQHLNQKFDIIIEDCSHRLIDQILCFSENFKNLKSGGIFIIEDLNFPNIWTYYFKDNWDKVEIFSHPKYPEKIKTEWLKKGILPEKYLVETRWGYLTNAYIELLRYALNNSNCDKFMFVSESGLPIKPFYKFYDMLKNGNIKTSYIKSAKESNNVNQNNIQMIK